MTHETSAATAHNASPVIAMLDSGVGGLATLERLLETTPDLSYAYLADGAFFPYGPKPALVVRERVAELMSALSKQFSVSAMVIACNTAAQEELCLQPMPYPVFDPIESTSCAIRRTYPQGGAHLALLATPTTVDTGRYPKLLTPQFGVTQLVTAELVTAIEAGHTVDSAEMQAVLQPIFERIRRIEPDAIVLGCTHFSWVETAFAKEFPTLALFNSAACLADDVARLVGENPDLCGNAQFMLNTQPSADFETTLASLSLSTLVEPFEVASEGVVATTRS